MRCLLLFPLCLAAAACADGGDAADRDAALIAADPVVARALHDPLMSDPDLASRNTANAVIGFADSSALPVITASAAEARAARAALRLELLETGPIPDLPPPREDEGEGGGESLGPMTSPAALLAAVGAPAACAARIKEDFAIAAALPRPARLPRAAMVVQAGGADAPGCRLSIIRYTSAAPAEDLLHFHHAMALRAGLASVHHARPAAITARGAGAVRLVVHSRPAAHGLTGVTLVYRGR